MHRFKWGIFCCQILARLTASSPIAGSPTIITDSSPNLIERAPGTGPSSYPYGTPHVNEMSWRRWDPKDTSVQRDDGRKLHDAYPAMKEMAVYAWHEADAKTATFKRWFAEADADKVKNVLGRIMDKSIPVPEALPRMKDRVLYRNDYGGQCDPKTYAYTSFKSGKHHFCDKGLGQRQIDSLTCNDLDGDANGVDKWSSKKIRTISGTMLHEAVHWNEIGKAVLGSTITDIPKGSGASNCFELSGADKLLNAQNYAYLASEAYLQKKGCKFVNPPANTKEEDEKTDAIENDNTNAISIIYRSFVKGTYSENDWYVYDTPVSVSALCRPADQTVAKWPADDGPGPASRGPEWPAGIFDIRVDDMDCQYKNNGQNAGALWCKGRDGPISCYKDSKLDKREGKYCDGGRIYQQPYIYCEWN